MMGFFLPSRRYLCCDVHVDVLAWTLMFIATFWRQKQRKKRGRAVVATLGSCYNWWTCFCKFGVDMFGDGCFSDFCFRIWYVILWFIYLHALFIIAHYCCTSSLQEMSHYSWYWCHFFVVFGGETALHPADHCTLFAHLHPGRLTWNLRIHPWKRKNIFRSIIFRFYVNLRECMGSSWCISGRNHSSGGKVHKSPCTRCNDGFIGLGCEVATFLLHLLNMFVPVHGGVLLTSWMVDGALSRHKILFIFESAITSNKKRGYQKLMSWTNTNLLQSNWYRMGITMLGFTHCRQAHTSGPQMETDYRWA